MRKRTCVRLPFTPEEDQKLLEVISNSTKSDSRQKSNLTARKEQSINWKKVSNQMGDRTVRQCKERYFHYLSPTINKKEWTNEEDSLLMSSVARLGKRWKVFERLFTKRTEIDIRNRYYVLQRRITKIVKPNSCVNCLDITKSANIILNTKEIYYDFFKPRKKNKKTTEENIGNDSDETLDLPCDAPVNNDEINKTEKFENFFNKITDISFDEYQSNHSQKNLISLFNGRVYDNFYINDSTFN